MIYEFQAKQDLHGYDKPWAPGAGVNLFDPQWWRVISNYNEFYGLHTPTSGNKDRGTLLTVGETYHLHYDNSVSQKLGVYLCRLGSTSQSTIAGNDTRKILDTNLTISDTDYYCIWAYSTTAFPAVENQIFQIEKGSSYSGFSPYSNICPPEGFNMWDPDNNEFIQVYAGFVNTNTRELYLRPVYQEYAGEELVGPWMSSLDPYAEDSTPTEGAFVIDFGGELTSFEITAFMLQTLLDSLGIRQHFTDGAGLLNSLMDQAQGRVRSEEELLHLSRPLNVIAIGDQLPAGLTFKPISKDVLPGLPGKFIR